MLDAHCQSAGFISAPGASQLPPVLITCCSCVDVLQLGTRRSGIPVCSQGRRSSPSLHTGTPTWRPTKADEEPSSEPARKHGYMRQRQRMHSCLSLALLASAGAAIAQSTTNDDAPGAIEEILVTAQRRSESSQDVPISIEVLKSERLAAVGVLALPDLNVVTPGLQFQRAGATTSPFLRGVGAQTSTAGSESALALFVDGVYVAAQGASLMSLSNINSVEVDKGPQGTLFGRVVVKVCIEHQRAIPKWDRIVTRECRGKFRCIDHSSVLGTADTTSISPTRGNKAGIRGSTHRPSLLRRAANGM